MFSKRVPHVSLGAFPTPVTKLESLGKSLGIKNLYLKNDGVSGVPFGGNKVRKLEFLLADAVEKGYRTVATIGRAGSNHTLTTVSCAQQLGLKPHVFLSPQLNAAYLRRNLLLTHHFGGKIHWFQRAEDRDEAAEAFDAYFIPLGASCPRGVLGYVDAVYELKNQIDQGLLPEPDFIYLPVGSAGTATGIMLGLKLLDMKTKVVPVRISDTPKETLIEFIDLLNETSKFLCDLDNTCQRYKFSELCVGIRNEFVGDLYAEVTPLAAQAVKLLHETEGLKLEGTYTGKALAALMYDLKEPLMKDKTFLFWNTFCYGDFSVITNTVDYKELPEGLHVYFEKGLQELDQGL